MPEESRNSSAEGFTPPDAQLRSACTECHRRKQKCNRQWPCNNCQKRKVADQCRFRDDSKASPGEDAWAASLDVKRKRDMQGSDGESDDDVGDVLEAIGYTRLHLLSKLDQDSGSTKVSEQYYLDPKTSPQVRRALDVLPPRHIVDSLVQSFLDVVNFYYYIVYPPNFSKEYSLWWDDYTKDRPCGVQWTCLLLMVCACSVQHVDSQLGARVESEVGASVKDLTQRYHDAARELHSVIPVGYGHIYTVQYLLHSCYWFKAEARFAECWQVLGAVVREAQMINLHKTPVGQLPGFELEMKRRLWCIVDSWDWLVSSLLARPMLIDRGECDIGLPSLTLEDYPASPMLHLKLQSELVGLIFKRFGPPKVLEKPEDIRAYQDILEGFIKTFPAEYALDHPNTPEHENLPWIALHRHYMHTCTLSIALGPFRGYMAKTMTGSSSSTDLEFRQTGIDYALRLMDAVHRFFEYVWTRDTTFHFVPFCIFDTAALLCSVIIHAEDGNVPRRQEVAGAISKAFSTLKKLRTATNTAKAPYDVLRRLIKKLPSSSGMLANDAHKKRRFDPPSRNQGAIPIAPVPSSKPDVESNLITRAPAPMPAQPVQQLPSQAEYRQYPNPTPEYPNRVQAGEQSYMPYSQNGPNPGFHNYTYAPQQQMHPAPASSAPLWNGEINNQYHVQNLTTGPLPVDMGFQAISDAELGDLAMLWNWQSLDLGFTTNPIYQERSPT